MSVKFQDYYATLGVGRDASADDIRKAYRALARKHHPDVDKSSGANDRFKHIIEAYEVLKDDEKRKLYDRLGANWKNGQEFTPPPDFGGAQFRGARTRGAPPDFDGMGGFSSFFESLFGGGGVEWQTMDADGDEDSPPRARPRAGRSVEAEITLSLEDAFRGSTMSFSIDTGAGPKSYDVKIPAGTTEGRTIRMKGQGGQGRSGAPAGDLLLRVRLAPHPRFTVDDHDLSTTLAIAPWEAALGAKVSLTTLDGGEAVVQVPAGSSSGKKLRLRGLGFPRPQGARGDLLIELRIVVPDTLTDAERKLYEELAQKSPFRPR